MFDFPTTTRPNIIDEILSCVQDNGKTVRLICVIIAIYLCAAMGTRLDVGG